jgi:hypothetical protein
MIRKTIYTILILIWLFGSIFGYKWAYDISRNESASIIELIAAIILIVLCGVSLLIIFVILIAICYFFIEKKLFPGIKNTLHAINRAIDKKDNEIREYFENKKRKRNENR